MYAAPLAQSITILSPVSLRFLGSCALGEFDVALLRALHPLCAADAVRRSQHRTAVGFDEPLDLEFHFVRQLVAVRIEKLDPVVLRICCVKRKSSRRYPP